MSCGRFRQWHNRPLWLAVRRGALDVYSRLCVYVEQGWGSALVEYEFGNHELSGFWISQVPGELLLELKGFDS